MEGPGHGPGTTGVKTEQPGHRHTAPTSACLPCFVKRKVGLARMSGVFGAEGDHLSGLRPPDARLHTLLPLQGPEDKMHLQEGRGLFHFHCRAETGDAARVHRGAERVAEDEADDCLCFLQSRQEGLPRGPGEGLRPVFGERDRGFGQT